MDIFVYLCDRKKCPHCFTECNNTFDLKHSANYDHIPTKEEKKKHFQFIVKDNDGNSFYAEMED